MIQIQIAWKLIDNYVRENGPADRTTCTRVITEAGHATDAWGNALEVEVYPQAGRNVYLIISKGADGRLDVDNPAIYLEMAPSNIRGRVDRDIVLRDGELITDAGK